jgi:hypothetical protein
MECTQNYTGYGWEGSAYKKTKNMRTSDVAKLIKKELKEKFPNWKFSVKTELYSGGSSINVRITSLPYNPLNPNYDFNRYGSHVYIEKFEQDLKKAESVGNKYRYSDSDAMIDYFSTNFYYFVDLDWELRNEFEKELKKN